VGRLQDVTVIRPLVFVREQARPGSRLIAPTPPPARPARAASTTRPAHVGTDARQALRDLSYAAALPVVDENCPACFEAPRERQHIKKLLAREEAQFPNLFQVSPPRRHEAA
jgi:hypothetical protein